MKNLDEYRKALGEFHFWADEIWTPDDPRDVAVAEGALPDPEVQRFGKLPRRKLSFGLPDDAKFPPVLVGIALAVYLAVGLLLAGLIDPLAGIIASVLLLVQAFVATGVSIAACFLVAALFGTSFGEFKSAIIKLAAATMFPLAFALVFTVLSPFLSGLALIVLSLSLLKTLFDLEPLELIAMVLAEATVAAAASALFGFLECSVSRDCRAKDEYATNSDCLRASIDLP